MEPSENKSGTADLNIKESAVGDVYGTVRRLSDKFSIILRDLNELSSNPPEEAQEFRITDDYYQFRLLQPDMDDTNSTIDKLYQLFHFPTTGIIDNEFRDFLKKIGIDPVTYQEIVDDGFTAQGYSIIDGKIFISAYYSAETLKDEDYLEHPEKYNSRVYIYDNGELLGRITLENHAHVGGITYDPENKIMFVTGFYGKVNAYNYQKIEEYLAGYYKRPANIELFKGEYGDAKLDCDININDVLESKNKDIGAATIFYKNGKLYVATYDGHGDMVEYTYNYDGKTVTATPNPNTIQLHGAVQGIAIYNDNGKEYIIEAASTAVTDSCIKIYDKETGEYVASIAIKHKGLEGIDISPNGDISGVFEYGDASTEVLNFNQIIEDYNKDREELEAFLKNSTDDVASQTALNEFYSKHPKDEYSELAAAWRAAQENFGVNAGN